MVEEGYLQTKIRELKERVEEYENKMSDLEEKERRINSSISKLEELFERTDKKLAELNAIGKKLDRIEKDYKDTYDKLDELFSHNLKIRDFLRDELKRLFKIFDEIHSKRIEDMSIFIFNQVSKMLYETGILKQKVKLKSSDTKKIEDFMKTDEGKEFMKMIEELK